MSTQDTLLEATGSEVRCDYLEVVDEKEAEVLSRARVSALATEEVLGGREGGREGGSKGVRGEEDYSAPVVTLL